MNVKSVVAILVGIVLMGTQAWAFELITVEDVKQKVIVNTDLLKTSDNAIILFDSSSSMAKPFKDSGMSRYDVAKKLLIERNEYFPDLGHNIGLYLYTPWKEVFPVQKYDREKFARALSSLPEIAREPQGVTATQLILSSCPFNILRHESAPKSQILSVPSLNREPSFYRKKTKKMII